MTSHPQPSPDHPASRVVRAAALVTLALFAAAMWAVWLGWDTEYYEVDGVTQGPYREWQVIGCGLTVVAAAVLVQVWLRGAVGALPLAVAAVGGFAAPWTVQAASTDDSGLFVVGLVMLLVAGGGGLAALLAGTGAAVRRRQTPE